MKTPLRLLTMLVAAAVCSHAVSVFRGLEPGKSNRSDVSRILGPPVRAAGAFDEHNPGDGSGTVFLAYRADGAIDSIEWRFRTSLAREALLGSLGVGAEPPVASDSASGRAREYFGGARTIMLVHASADAAGPAAALLYLSQERFDAEVARLRSPSAVQPPPAPTTTAAPSAPAAPAAPSVPPAPAAPAVPDEVRAQYNPEACRDTYEWARGEQKAADKSKDAQRRQAILEIRITAQRGDCEPAHRLADSYKNHYR